MIGTVKCSLNFFIAPVRQGQGILKQPENDLVSCWMPLEYILRIHQTNKVCGLIILKPSLCIAFKLLVL